VVTADRHGFTVEPTFPWKLRNEVDRLARMSRRRASHPEEYRRNAFVRDPVCSSDEGHDMLMRLYHSRYTEQIETADAATILARSQ
jgi:hypothetical protein